MDDEPIRPSTARRMQMTEDELEKEKDVLEQVVKEGMDRVNTVVEVCITLVALYLIIELNHVPMGCGIDTVLSPCIVEYGKAKGSIDQDFWLTSCGALRQQCFASYVWRLDNAVFASSTTVTTLRGNLTSEIELCQCLLSQGTGYFDVYCTFRGSTLVCLLVGLILLYGLQISGDLQVTTLDQHRRMAPWQTYPEDIRFHKNRKPKYDSDRDDQYWYKLPRARNSRRITVILIIMYFLGILIFYNYITTCTGPEFEDLREVIGFIAIACAFVCILMALWEEWLWSSPHFYFWKQFAREYRMKHVGASRFTAYKATFRLAFPQSKQSEMFAKPEAETAAPKKKTKRGLRTTQVTPLQDGPQPGNESNV